MGAGELLENVIRNFKGYVKVTLILGLERWLSHKALTLQV